MNRIETLDPAQIPSLTDLRDTLNDVICVMNTQKCVEDEISVFETLADGDCFLISIDDGGVLVACNNGGTVELTRVREERE